MKTKVFSPQRRRDRREEGREGKGRMGRECSFLDFSPSQRTLRLCGKFFWRHR